MNRYDSMRRAFLKNAALLGGGYAALAENAFGAEHTHTSSVELLNVGAMCLSDNSHLNYNIWAPMINPVDSGAWPVGRTTGMRIAYCWDRDYEVAKEFARTYKCEAVKNYYDMVGKVEGMIFGGFNEVPWWPKLAKPYLEAGIPCYLNRPFAYSMEDANTLIELSKRHDAPILCTDEREYIEEAINGRTKVKELLRDGYRITGATGDNSAGNEYPQHGVHGLYFMLAILGLDVAEASLQADGWWREKTQTALNPQTWAQITLRYHGVSIPDVGEQTQPFVASQLQSGAAGDATMRIYYKGSRPGFYDIRHPWTGGERMDRMYYLFFPTILAMQRMFIHREMQWSHEYIAKKTRIFLAAFKSHLEHEGKLIDVDSLPDSWRAPSPYPDWLDESIFE